MQQLFSPAIYTRLGDLYLSDSGIIFVMLCDVKYTHAHWEGSHADTFHEQTLCAENIVFSVLDSLRDHCLRKQLTQAVSKVAACSCTYEALKTSKTFPLNASSLFRHFSH